MTRYPRGDREIPGESGYLSEVAESSGLKTTFRSRQQEAGRGAGGGLGGTRNGAGHTQAGPADASPGPARPGPATERGPWDFLGPPSRDRGEDSHTRRCPFETRFSPEKS